MFRGRWRRANATQTGENAKMSEPPMERSEAIAQSLDRVLADPDRAVRLAVLRRMQREKVPVQFAALRHWLNRLAA